MVTEFSLSWLELSTLEFERFCLRRRKKPDGGGTGKRGKKGKSSAKGKENVDKRAVDSGRVGERAKEALGEWLGMAWMACGMMLVWGLFFGFCFFVFLFFLFYFFLTEWSVPVCGTGGNGGGGVSGRRELKI